MRAFILNQSGEPPQFGDFKEPTAESGEVIKVLAAGLNPVDRYMSMSPDPVLPRVVGIEGVGMFRDERVYFERSVAPFGSIAEQAVTNSDNVVPLPEEISNGMALALGIAGMAAWLPLTWKAHIQPGESVLILGATGVQGQIAVQAAHLLQAGMVVAAGRNREVLESLEKRGANNIAVLEGDLAQALKGAAPESGYDVVIDSLFGAPFNALLDSGTLHAKSRVVVLGGSAGQEATLGFRQLQATRGATIAGYSSFFVPQAAKHEAYLTLVNHAVAGDIIVEVEEYSLEQAREAWDKQASGPHRKLIIVP